MASPPRCSTSVPSISIAFNLRLSDVAEVRPGYEDPPTLLIRHQGESALALGAPCGIISSRNGAYEGHFRISHLVGAAYADRLIFSKMSSTHLWSIATRR